MIREKTIYLVDLSVFPLCWIDVVLFFFAFGVKELRPAVIVVLLSYIELVVGGDGDGCLEFTLEREHGFLSRHLEHTAEIEKKNIFFLTPADTNPTVQYLQRLGSCLSRDALWWQLFLT